MVQAEMTGYFEERDKRRLAKYGRMSDAIETFERYRKLEYIGLGILGLFVILQLFGIIQWYVSVSAVITFVVLHVGFIMPRKNKAVDEFDRAKDER